MGSPPWSPFADPFRVRPILRARERGEHPPASLPTPGPRRRALQQKRTRTLASRTFSGELNLSSLKKRDLTVVWCPIEALIPYARNARTHSDEQVAQIAASIKEFGWTNPVLVDGESGIVAGHGRVLAARKLGLTEVPTLALEGLSKAQLRAYVLADNKLALNAGWDDALLKIELGELKTEGFDLGLIGFSMDEIGEIFKDADEESGDGAAGDAYTSKIVAPVYEPKGEKPPLAELCDLSKTQKLVGEIEASSAPDDIKQFLRYAAQRHIVFDYEKIAEYYAHAPKDVQELMENSALVIIDFNKAIEQGFVVMSQELAEAFKSDV